MPSPRLLLALALLAPAAAQASAATRAASAKESLKALTQPGQFASLSDQVRVTIGALIEPALDLPAPLRRSLEALQHVDPADVLTLAMGIVEQDGQGFLKRSCGTGAAGVAAGAPPGDAPEVIVKRCKLTPGKTAPATLQGLKAPALLLAGMVAELMVKRGASPEELALARLLAQLGQPESAKPLTAP